MDKKWISVEKELPNDIGDVLVYMAKFGDYDNNGGYCVIAWYYDSKWLTDKTDDIEDNPDYYTVTHWQPLPPDPISLRKERKLKLQKICSNLQK